MRIFFLLVLTFCLYACSTERNSSKYSLEDGYYTIKVPDTRPVKRYVNNTDDSIYVYSLDNLKSPTSVFSQQEGTTKYLDQHFSRKSFDIDFLTMPFKFRPVTNTLPNQFTTNLNGAVYVGSRNDIYKLSYTKDPLGIYQKSLKHYGVSFGLFTGLGGSALNPSTTNNLISSEYDGLIWSKGFAAIVGIDKVTLGLALGFDNLLDPNRTYWIYQNKPWIGLAFGLNIN